MRTICMVFTIIIGAIIFARLMALSGLNMWLIDILTDSALPPFAVVIMTLLVLFILGFIMPVTSTIVLVVPFLYPIFTDVLGYSGIWFGVLSLRYGGDRCGDAAHRHEPLHDERLVWQGCHDGRNLPGSFTLRRRGYIARHPVGSFPGACPVVTGDDVNCIPIQINK